jgi:nitrile hydratase
MDGMHDLGGRQGFGAVARGGDAEVSFTAEWHRRVYGMVALGSRSNLDAFRHAIERIPPASYLPVGYWGRWLAALERLVAEADDSVRREERGSAARAIDRAPLFQVGDRVRVRDLHTNGHTRMPAYVRGRRGVVALQQGGWVYPDTNAHGQGEQPVYAYAVRFDGRELWGGTAEAGTVVHVDLFEPYLQPERQA